MGSFGHLNRVCAWGFGVLGWSAVGCEPAPLDLTPPHVQVLWTFRPPAAGSGGGLGPWRWNDQVIASSGDTLWQINAWTGSVTRRSALPGAWCNAFFPGETSLQKGEWAYALDASGLLAVHLPSLMWSVLPWPSGSPAGVGSSEMGVEPALFSGPNDAVGLITKHKEPGQSGWSTTAWLWTPNKDPHTPIGVNSWKVLWTLGWREPAVGFADGLAWHRRENSRRDAPAGFAGWWRHRAPNGGTLVHTNGQRIQLVGNPTGHPPLPLTDESALVVFEDRVTAYHSKGNVLWSAAYGPPGHSDQHLWLGWVHQMPCASGGPLPNGGGATAIWIKGSDDGLLAVDGQGRILGRWRNAGWSPSGKPSWDSISGLWYCAEGALWNAGTNPDSWAGSQKIADENFQCTPVVWQTDRGTLVVARNGLKISAYLCRQP